MNRQTPLFPTHYHKSLQAAFDDVDMDCRRDFSRGYIVDENDYTSNLMSRLRSYHYTRHQFRISVHAQKVPAVLERSWGVDACIIFVNESVHEGKIALFEAKVEKAGWDYLQRQVSHFSSQLARQAAQLAMQPTVIIWEQFYSQRPPGMSVAWRAPLGSTVVLHAEAHQYDQLRQSGRVWQTPDLDQLVNQSGTGVKTMGDMVGKICDCSLGGRFSTDDMLKLLNADFPVSRLMIISVGASQWSRSFRKFLPAKFSPV